MATLYWSYGVKAYPACTLVWTPKTTGVLNRSDVKSATRRSTPEEDGWREPLPYSRSVTEGDYRFAKFAYSVAGKYSAYCPPEKQLVNKSDGAIVQTGLSSTFSSVPSPPTGFQSNLVNKAMAKLSSNGLNLAVAFGERKETISMVSNVVKTLTESVRAIRHGDVRRVAKILRCKELIHKPSMTAANVWLGYQYGWRPLINDVYSAVEKLNTSEMERRKRYMVTSKASARWEDTSLVADNQTLTHSGVLVQGKNVRYRRIVKTRAFIRLDYYLDNPSLAEKEELGINNPLSLAWELLPLSFVFDWFLPVGDYLAALTATNGLIFRGGSISTKTELKVRLEKAPTLYWSSTTVPLDPKHPSWVRAEGINGGNVLYRKMSFARTVYSTQPIPGLPCFDLGFSPTRILSGISLLRAEAKRTFRF